VPVAPALCPETTYVSRRIAGLPAGVTRDDLARRFVWPLERVERAIAVLELRLRPSGRRLRRIIRWHRYAPRPEPVTPEPTGACRAWPGPWPGNEAPVDDRDVQETVNDLL
jgi:hypothetical protein